MSYLKYILYKKQESTDNGSTWHDVEPIVTQPSTAPVGVYDTLAECESSSSIDYSSKYLTIVPKNNGTIKLTNNKNWFYYSKDSGNTWTMATRDTNIAMISSQEIWFKGDRNPGTDVGVGTFSTNVQFDVEGNAMSMLFGDDFSDKIDLTGKKYALCKLFEGSPVINSKNLILPATTLSDYCYRAMFHNCSSLLNTPYTLPATTLPLYCYASMFAGCTNIKATPEIKVKIAGEACCAGMFGNCTSLEYVSDLNAESVYNGSFAGMFSNCTSLVNAQKILPATRIGYNFDIYSVHTISGAYHGMFMGCTSLIVGPELPARNLVMWGYYQMFAGCTSLKYVKCLAEYDNDSSVPYAQEMFDGISTIGVLVKSKKALLNPSTYPPPGASYGASTVTWRNGLTVPSQWVVIDE